MTSPSPVNLARGLLHLRHYPSKEVQHGNHHRSPHQNVAFFVHYEEKVFEDVKAEPGEKALVTFHTVAFEGSIGLVNILQAPASAAKGL